MKIYSKNKNAFFAAEFKDDYLASGSWPDDGVEITDEEHRDLLGILSEGKELSSDSNGAPIAVQYAPANDEQKSLLFIRDMNNILSETNWTQLLDTPTEIQRAYAIYRQAVRDAVKTSTPGADIVWPEEPEIENG